jgi:mono/diheme cytochrome c family protein
MFRRSAHVSLALISLAALLAQLGCGKQPAEATKQKSATAGRPSVSAAVEPARVAVAKKLSFNEHVQPILAENCYACHGADPGSRKADLRLDRAEHAFRKRKEGEPAIVPGKADESPLVQRIEAKDGKKVMPPPEAHKTLQPEQIALLRQWVAEGAEYQEHWSFIAPRRPAVPAVAADMTSSRRNPIDDFILARLAREKLAIE